MLNKAQLAASLLNVQKANLPNPTAAQEAEMQAYANGVADAVDLFVRGLEITYIAGLANSGGPVTGTFQFSLN